MVTSRDGGAGRARMWWGVLWVLAWTACLAPPDEEHRCVEDADCVPASCCHATAAVHRDHAPDCTDTGCTTDYQPCTDDNPNIFPVCRLGACTLNTTPACAL